jgi:hypothetical protein
MTVGSVTSQLGPFSDLRGFRPKLRLGSEAVTQKSDDKTGGVAPMSAAQPKWFCSQKQT